MRIPRQQEGEESSPHPHLPLPLHSPPLPGRPWLLVWSHPFELSHPPGSAALLPGAWGAAFPPPCALWMPHVGTDGANAGAQVWWRQGNLMHPSRESVPHRPVPSYSPPGRGQEWGVVVGVQTGSPRDGAGANAQPLRRLPLRRQPLRRQPLRRLPPRRSGNTARA